MNILSCCCAAGMIQEDMLQQTQHTSKGLSMRVRNTAACKFSKGHATSTAWEEHHQLKWLLWWPQQCIRNQAVSRHMLRDGLITKRLSPPHA